MRQDRELRDYTFFLVGQFWNRPGIKSTGGCTAKVLGNQKWLCRFLQIHCSMKHVMALIQRAGSGRHYPDNGFITKFRDSVAWRGSEAWVMLMCRGNLSALHANKSLISYLLSTVWKRQEFKGKPSEQHWELAKTCSFFFFFLMKIQLGWCECYLILISTDCCFIGSCEGVRTQLFLKWQITVQISQRFIWIPSTPFKWRVINNMPAVVIIVATGSQQPYI